MKLPNNLGRDTVTEIFETDQDSLAKAQEKAGVASNSRRPVEACLGMAEIDYKNKLPELCERFKLNERESQVFTAWFKTGVRDNTATSFYITQEAFRPFSNGSQARSLAAILFLDTFNRADEVFDQHREDYVDYQRRRVLNEDLDHTPILNLDNGDIATVGDFERVLFKIIQNSGVYTKEEQSLLRWHIDHFIETSTQAQRDFEAKKSYSEDEALALRWLTVGPLGDTVASIYATSSWELSTNANENAVFEANNTFLKMVMVWQMVDDYYDLYEDVKRKNVSLVVGMMNDAFESIYSLSENYQQVFEKDYPQTVTAIRKLYKQLTRELNPNTKSFLESRVPHVFLENEDNGED